MSCVECCRIFNASANILIAIFRVSVKMAAAVFAETLEDVQPSTRLPLKAEVTHNRRMFVRPKVVSGMTLESRCEGCVTTGHSGRCHNYEIHIFNTADITSPGF
jgi:hypothetical protein